MKAICLVITLSFFSGALYGINIPGRLKYKLEKTMVKKVELENEPLKSALRKLRIIASRNRIKLYFKAKYSGKSNKGANDDISVTMKIRDKSFYDTIKQFALVTRSTCSVKGRTMIFHVNQAEEKKVNKASKVTEVVNLGEGIKFPSNIIDPDNSIYGIKIGTTEKEFIDEAGKPTGKVSISAEKTGLIYGRCHMFLFTDGKLSGAWISPCGVIGYRISHMMYCHSSRNKINWKLNNGIEYLTNLKTAEQAVNLGGERNYRKFYLTTNTKVEFSMSGREGEYKVRGLFFEVGRK